MLANPACFSRWELNEFKHVCLASNSFFRFQQCAMFCLCCENMETVVSSNTAQCAAGQLEGPNHTGMDWRGQIKLSPHGHLDSALALSRVLEGPHCTSVKFCSSSNGAEWSEQGLPGKTPRLQRRAAECQRGQITPEFRCSNHQAQQAPGRVLKGKLHLVPAA